MKSPDEKINTQETVWTEQGGGVEKEKIHFDPAINKSL